MRLFFFALLALASTTLWANCQETISATETVDPTEGTSWQVTTKSYLTSRSSSFIFIVSPIVGETVLDRRLAQRFCANGLSAIIASVVKADNPLTADSDLSIHDKSYVRALAGIQALMAEIQLTTPSARFGILGMSLGGMLSAYIAGAEPRIEASVIVAGAGNAAGVLADSDQEIVRSQRERRFGLFNISTPKEYENLLRPLIVNDPLSVAGNIRPNSSYLFIANGDTTVPTRYQRELRDAIASPVVYAMNVGHTQALIRAGTIHAAKITGFFTRRLN
jgi:dienelactone hydrolase